jgi:hypothetical protein
MSWSRKLPSPIALKDGRTLSTLADARSLMQSLPISRQSREHWLYVEGLMKEAAMGRGAIRETQTHLTRALRLEGLIS